VQTHGTGMHGQPCTLQWVQRTVLSRAHGQRYRPQAGATKEQDMLHYAVVFLIIALIAAVFGFGGIAAGAVGIAKILFFVFVIMAVVTFVVGLSKRG
jgi:uncharacterized membrane protein YtjA (UPF0391 family)